MIPLEHFTVSLALAVIVAFVAGAGFGVWLALFTFTRAQRQFRADQIIAAPVTFSTDDIPRVTVSPEMAAELKEKLKQDNGPNTFERTP